MILGADPVHRSTKFWEIETESETMSEKSRLHRTRKEIIHSIKTQQQDFEVFLTA